LIQKKDTGFGFNNSSNTGSGLSNFDFSFGGNKSGDTNLLDFNSTNSNIEIPKIDLNPYGTNTLFSKNKNELKIEEEETTNVKILSSPIKPQSRIKPKKNFMENLDFNKDVNEFKDMFAPKQGIKVLIIEKEDDDYKNIDISRDDDDLNKSKTYNITKSDYNLNEKFFSKTPNKDEKLQTEKKSINETFNLPKLVKPTPVKRSEMLDLNSSSEDTITLVEEEIKTKPKDIIVDKKLTPILTKEGYYCKPSMNELEKLGKDQLKKCK